MSPIEIVWAGRAGSFGSLWINLTCADVLINFDNKENIIFVDS